ncbi:1-deoxy-D-xylulose-5-phosphate reductoisomerase, partial [bacterium]|nr:1-deoxy-D-xylulose-5-phosphate reductoisomerase [bacterium]
KLTITCGSMGGIMPAVLNAANEAAVYKFLNKEINFLDIERIVSKAVMNTKNILNPTLEEIFSADITTRASI